MARGLTVFAIKAAKAKARATGQRVQKGDGRALFYIALPTGGESWVQYFRIRKQLAKATNKEPGLGIAGARKWAADVRERATRGVDPRDEKRVAKVKARAAAANTLLAVAEEYLGRHKKLRTVGQRSNVGSTHISQARRPAD